MLLRVFLAIFLKNFFKKIIEEKRNGKKKIQGVTQWVILGTIEILLDVSGLSLGVFSLINPLSEDIFYSPNSSQGLSSCVVIGPIPV